ncbi:MAG: hypothetical protein WBN20_15745 [Eudoraea sp.]|uniref:hypothetical protein n=1 Tax=Eudoraea sp. TaxID=1979955 RepID=UPI003C716796
MSATDDNIKSTFSFSKPAIYQIKVLGKVPSSWSERLSGMDLSYRNKKSGVETTLIGKMSDQAQLSGLLISLYELHMSVLSVEKLNTNI